MQIERGLLLESMVMVLVCEGLWELYTQCDRMRFALTYKIQVLMSLYVSKQYRLSSVMAHDILCMNNMMICDGVPKHIQMWYGLGTIPYTHIWPDSMVLLLGILCRMKKKMCMARDGDDDGTFIMLPYQRLLAYRLLYVVWLNGDGCLYTQNIIDSIKVLTKPRDGNDVKDGNLYGDGVIADDTIILPLPTFLPYTITYTNASHHTHGNLYIQEDKYVVNMCTYTLNPIHQNTATITIRNPYAIPVLQVMVVYKRLHPHIHEDVYGYGVPFTYHHLAYTDTIINRILLQDITTIQDDEFVCTNLKLIHTHTDTQPYNTYTYTLSPHILGEFYVDRVYVLSQNTLYVDKSLLSSAHTHTKYTPPSPAPYTPFTLLSPSKSIQNNSTSYKQSLLINSVGDILPCLTLTHQEVQVYFDTHTIVQFVSSSVDGSSSSYTPSSPSPPAHTPSQSPFLHATIHTSLLSTYHHLDHLLITLHTNEFERIDNLAITLNVKSIRSNDGDGVGNGNGNGECDKHHTHTSVMVNSQQNHHIIFQPYAGPSTPVSPYRRQSSAGVYGDGGGNGDVYGYVNKIGDGDIGVIVSMSPSWVVQLYMDNTYTHRDSEHTVLTKQNDGGGKGGVCMQLLSSIPAGRYVAITIPYTIANTHTHTHATQAHRVQLEVVCMGNLFQSNCMVPFVMQVPHTLYTHTVLAGQVSALCVYGGGAHTSSHTLSHTPSPTPSPMQNICVYGSVCNDSDLQIHVVGYSVRVLVHGVWEDLYGDNCVCKVLSMGEDLPLLSSTHTHNSSQAHTQRVCLLPHEDYHFHLMLETLAHAPSPAPLSPYTSQALRLPSRAPSPAPSPPVHAPFPSPFFSSKDVYVEVIVHYVRQPPASSTYTTLIHNDVYTYTLPYISSSGSEGFRNVIPRVYSSESEDIVSVSSHTQPLPSHTPSQALLPPPPPILTPSSPSPYPCNTPTPYLTGLLTEVLVLYAHIHVHIHASGVRHCVYEVYASETLDEDNVYKFNTLQHIHSHLDIPSSRLGDGNTGMCMCMCVYESTQYVPLGLCMNTHTHIHSPKEGVMDIQIAIVTIKAGNIHLPPLQVSCCIRISIIFMLVYHPITINLIHIYPTIPHTYTQIQILDETGKVVYGHVYEVSTTSPYTHIYIQDQIDAQSLDRVFRDGVMSEQEVQVV
ncbi:hypothetical protein EON63_03160 [archaeon]|nr:MAG: hypothetical protein EON63_03160 [archaeon]